MSYCCFSFLLMNLLLVDRLCNGQRYVFYHCSVVGTYFCFAVPVQAGTVHIVRPCSIVVILGYTVTFCRVCQSVFKCVCCICFSQFALSALASFATYSKIKYVPELVYTLHRKLRRFSHRGNSTNISHRNERQVSALRRMAR